MGIFKLCRFLCCQRPYANSDDEELQDATDAQAGLLSYVGKAAYEVLRTSFSHHHHLLWNVTTGEVIFPLHLTPSHDPKSTSDPIMNESDWFPNKMGEILARTEIWADVLSLSPPDGLFLEAVRRALQKIAIRAKVNNRTVIVRMMFGNIIGSPLNCQDLVRKLTVSVPAECSNNIRVWIGAWRRGLSWNHAKLIAVDGMYLHTGGHNMWDRHYLKRDPVYDLSIELKGSVTNDGHLFANDQWGFIAAFQKTCLGQMIENNVPDSFPFVTYSRVSIGHYPEDEPDVFPPPFKRKLLPGSSLVSARGSSCYALNPNAVPMLTLGRYGSILKTFRPADHAFIAMFGAAKKVIRLALQDIGPVCIPMTTITIPGLLWPEAYLSEFAKALMRDVEIEIILSNPNAKPDGLPLTEACYGNGWSIMDVSSEIMKRIILLNPLTPRDTIRQIISSNLRICSIKRGSESKNRYNTGKKIGLHSKHFIIDDKCAYIGSQNLYLCDLAEWGVVIDHEETVQQMMKEVWYPLWETSYGSNGGFTTEDVEEVVKGMEVNREGEQVSFFSSTHSRQMRADAVTSSLGTGISKRTIFALPEASRRNILEMTDND